MSLTGSPLILRREKMAISKLATINIPSPNHSGQRTYKVTRITPHCMVGQMTAKRCGELFEESSYQASSNYGIGTDGEISGYVDEKYRSWCSSSADNDNRAITIECASDTRSPYAMNTKVWASLASLCADICQRYGKTRLIWFGDKATTLAYKPGDTEMVLTAHRWFAAKSCPGDWLYNRLGKLAEEVMARLGESPAPKQVIETPNSAAAVLINNEESDREKAIWNFLIGKGLNAFAVAGLMGNLYAESALRPNNLQNSFERSLGMTDKGYTAAVNDGSYDNFVHDGAGYGLAQWTWHTRKQALLAYAREQGKSIDDIQMQLEFLWKELHGYSKSMATLKEGKSIRAVSDVILTDFEKPADKSADVKRKRAAFGQEIYNRQTKASETGAESTKQTLYCVQFGAFRLESGAKRKAKEVRAKGLDAIVTKQDGLYKVQLGAFANVSGAEVTVSRARRAGYNVIIKAKEV